MKTLPPQRLSPADYDSVKKQISKIFYLTVFKPILDLAAGYNAQLKVVSEESHKFLLKNAADTPLMTALRLGMIQYQDGIFSGKFSQATSANLRRLGARFDKGPGVFRLKDSEVPAGIKHTALTYKINVVKIHQVLIDKLNTMQTGLEAEFSKYEVDGKETLFKVKDGFEKSAKSLEVMPQISQGSWDILEEEYNENVKLYVEKFSAESIIDLRDAVRENTLIGYRFDRLAAHIEDRYKTSAAKAEFLARTETSIFMAKFRELRFAEAGVRRYIWRTSGDQRVRDDHAHLNGRTFFYKQPPIADVATGTRANPGAIWNCRCMDEPVLEPLHAGAERVG